MKKHTLIRTIYLYLFTIIGLVLLVIGCVRIVDMVLKMYVFTQAEQEIIERPPIYVDGKSTDEDSFISVMEECEDKCEISEEHKQGIASWLASYETWKDSQVSDYITQKRHRDMSSSLAYILVGLPLYLFHWSIIKKETKVA